MEIFTVFGISITSILILLISYLMLSNIFDTRDIQLSCIIAFIIITSIISILFATFVVDPESFGYQKIQTISENDIKR